MEESSQLGFAGPLTSETMLTVSKNAFNADRPINRAPLGHTPFYSQGALLPLGLLSLHVYTATFRVVAIHVYKIGLPFKLVLA